LLRHRVATVVGFTLDALLKLERTKKLDVAGFVEAVPPVFSLQPKAQPLAALKILGRLSGTTSDQLVEALADGLGHPATAVQEAIVAILVKLADRAGARIAAVLPGKIDQAAPSVQQHLRQLLATVQPSAQETQAEPTRTATDVIAAARGIPSPWREAAGIDVLLNLMEGTGELSAVSFDPMAVPRLYREHKLEPIQTLDELIERLTVAMEKLDDAIEFELLIDGLSRLCDQRPDDFQARLAPLQHRIRKVMPMDYPFEVSNMGLPGHLFLLVWAWCDLHAPNAKSLVSRDDVMDFFVARLARLAVRLRKKEAEPLLACPTHRPGWIDPREMARRLAWYEEHNLEPSFLDFIVGLLRLAPDGRRETLAQAHSLKDRNGAAFRYALGGPLEDAPLPSAILIAAGRARSPHGEAAELHDLADASGPDASRPATYSWQVKDSGPLDPKKWARLYVSVEPRVPAFQQMRELPTVLLNAWEVRGLYSWPDGNRAGLNRCVAMLWPANLDPFFAAGARLYPGQYFDRATLVQRAHFLEPLFDPDVPFSEMAQVLVAISLTQQEPEVTGLAVDALIELIRDGRCVGTELGSVLARMVGTNLVKLNRLAKHLETVARASLLHAHACAQAVQMACASLTEAPKDLHFLLAPLLEWLTALEQGVLDSFRPLLEKVKTGKAALLAKKLLHRTPSPDKRQQLLMEALQGRVERTERWQRASPA
jgi:Family of unknown function (DUF6493)